jgi:enoyl-CoA hydratase/carnithine racemase
LADLVVQGSTAPFFSITYLRDRSRASHHRHPSGEAPRCERGHHRERAEDRPGEELGADVVIDYQKQAFETILHSYDVVIGRHGRRNPRQVSAGAEAGPPDPTCAWEIGAKARSSSADMPPDLPPPSPGRHALCTQNASPLRRRVTRASAEKPSTTTNSPEDHMDTSGSNSQPAGHIAVEGEAGVLVARIDGGPHALFDAEITKQLKELVDRADRDPDIRAVVFTGTHPDRFLSHSDVRWLQEGGTGFPPINTRIAKLVARTARLINRVPVVRTLAGMTRLKTLLQLDSFHATFLKMNASGTIFVAALNGSALAVGAELAFACDLRIMADGEHVIGLTEVLLALTPGGGGSQRLPRLIGRQQTLVAVLEGRPFTPAEALSLGAVDEVVPREKVLQRSIERAEYLSLRSKKSLGAIKRSIYFGSSLPLEDGLQLEHAEFLVRDQSKEAQRRMLEYIATTDATGELPLLNRETYARALAAGRLGGSSSE